MTPNQDARKKIAMFKQKQNIKTFCRSTPLNPNAPPFCPGPAMVENMATNSRRTENAQNKKIHDISVRDANLVPVRVTVVVTEGINSTSPASTCKQLEEFAKKLDHSTPLSHRPVGFENNQITRLQDQTGLEWGWNPFDSFYILNR